MKIVILPEKEVIIKALTMRTVDAAVGFILSQAKEIDIDKLARNWIATCTGYPAIGEEKSFTDFIKGGVK